jgi:hypothetical protein
VGRRRRRRADGARRAGEELHERHELAGLGVDDLGRRVVDDHRRGLPPLRRQAVRGGGLLDGVRLHPHVEPRWARALQLPPRPDDDGWWSILRGGGNGAGRRRKWGRESGREEQGWESYNIRGRGRDALARWRRGVERVAMENWKPGRRARSMRRVDYTEEAADFL